MDLRNLPEQLSSLQRVNQRRSLIEREFGLDLKPLEPADGTIGDAEKKNCEQMFGTVPVPVGYAGPLSIIFSNGTKADVHLPLATTEGALVASVNRGCKAASAAGITITKAVHHGITRSIAFRAGSTTKVQELVDLIRKSEKEWKSVGEQTSSHLKVTKYDLDLQKQYIFLTIAADTDAAMGMNMVTIAAQAIADHLTAKLDGVRCITVAGNLDSDKKASKRTHDLGRGYEVICSATLSAEIIAEVLKSSADDMLGVANAKLKAGSELAGAIGKNLHAANIIAALYLATGQDVAHTVEGALADTEVEKVADGLKITVRLPAIIVGVLGGGTSLPAQNACRELLLKNKTGLPAKQQLAESIAGAVLAGELSLLAAQASQKLAVSHQSLAR